MGKGIGESREPDRVRIADLLIAAGAVVGELDNEGASILTLAALDGRMGLLRFLVEKGADIRAKDKTGETALHNVVYTGKLEDMEFLLRRGVEIDAASCGYTPLLCGGDKDETATVEYLIAKGANLNTIASDGRGVLSFASESRRGSLEEVRLVLRHIEGLFPETILDGFHTALVDPPEEDADAWEEARERLLTRIRDVGVFGNDRHSSLQAAVEYGERGLVERLLQMGAPVNSIEGPWGTSLAAAVERGNLDILKLLLQNNADPNIVRRSHETPTLIAASYDSVQILSALLEAGADAEARDPVGRTMLGVAAARGSLGIVRWLITREAQLDSVSPPQTRLARDLVNTPDNLSRTPLMAAVRSGVLAIVEELLIASALPDIADAEGRTPLTRAVGHYERGDMPEITRELQRHGAKEDIQDCRGRGAAYWACRRRRDRGFARPEDHREMLIDAVKHRQSGSDPRDGRLMIHAAVAGEDFALLTKLLGWSRKRGSTVALTELDEDGWTGYNTAIAYKDERAAAAINLASNSY